MSMVMLGEETGERLTKRRWVGGSWKKARQNAWIAKKPPRGISAAHNGTHECSHREDQGKKLFAENHQKHGKGNSNPLQEPSLDFSKERVLVMVRS